MKKIYWILSVLFPIVVSCSNDISIDDRLNSAESLLQSSPDSALTLLSRIDSGERLSKEQNARHALLLSMAYEKNYIDLTSDSLINIAVDYYQHKSRSAEKFKAFYYQARIYQNAGQMDRAMESIVKAEHAGQKNVDPADLCRANLVKAQICSCRYALSEELQYLKKASFYADKSGNANNVVYATLQQASIYLADQNWKSLDSCLAVVNGFDDLPYYTRQDVLCIELQYALTADIISKDSLRHELAEYMRIQAGDEASLNWKTIAQAYLELNEPDSSICALQHHKDLYDVKSDESYWLLQSKANAAAARYDLAYENMQRYSDISDSLDIISIRQEVASVEERYLGRIKLRNQRLILMILTGVTFLIAFYSFLVLRRRRTQDMANKEKYAELKIEYEGLVELKKQYENDSVHKNMEHLFGDQSAGLLDRRITALGVFLSENKPESLRRVSGELDALGKNRDNVVDSIGLLYAMNHPAFVSALAECGLTASEIGFCCLLLLGFNVADAGSIVNNYSTYNLSSKIRKKVGIESGKGKLSTWLKELFRQTEIAASAETR